MAARGGENIYSLPSRLMENGHSARSAYNPHAGAQACGVCPFGVKSYFQA
jgi:hypothetical protein